MFDQNTIRKIAAYALGAIGLAVVYLLAESNAEPQEILAVISVLVVLPFFFVNPKVGFLVLIAARPLIDRLAQGVSFTIEDVITINLNSMIAIFVLGWGFLYLLIKKVRFFQVPAFIPLAFLFLLTFISIFTTEFRITAFGEWVRISSYIVMLMLGYYFITNLRELRNFSYAAVASLLAPMVLGLYQLLTQTGLSDEASSNRIFGTFAHPALFGQYLAAILIFAMVLTQVFKSKRVEFGLVALLSGAFLITTFTRGAWIYAFLGIAIAAQFLFRKYIAKTLMSLAALGILIVAFASLLQFYTDIKPYDTEIVQRFAESTSLEEDSSILWRIRFWEDVLTQAQPFYVHGYGAGTFIDFADNEVNARFDAHNDYIKLTVELGIAGCLALLALYLVNLAQSISWLKNTSDRTHKALAVLLLAQSVGVIFMSFFDNLYQNTTFFWFMFALIGGTTHILQNTKSAHPTKGTR